MKVNLPFIFALALVLSPGLLTASDEIPAKDQKTPIAIVNAVIHPMSAPVIDKGTIVFEAGLIKAIGTDIEIPANVKQIDAKGKHVYPGLIDAATILGLVEINSIRATVDTSEVGTLNPNVRSWVAFNPDSEIIPVTRSNGILLALTMPQGGLIAGRSAVMQLDGWTWEDMALKTDVGLHIQWPNKLRSKSNSDGGSVDEEKTGDTTVGDLRGFFAKCREYESAKIAGSFAYEDLRLESMLPVLHGEVPIFVHADKLGSIESAVAFSVEQNVRMILVGGYDAPHCAPLLRSKKVPVIVTGTYRLPSRDDDGFDDSYTVPERLRKAKIEFCMASRGRFGATGIRNLPYHAATAVAYGLPVEEAEKGLNTLSGEDSGGRRPCRLVRDWQTSHADPMQ